MSYPYRIPIQLSNQQQNVSFQSCPQPIVSQDPIKTLSPISTTSNNIDDSSNNNNYLSNEDIALLSYFLGDDLDQDIEAESPRSSTSSEAYTSSFEPKSVDNSQQCGDYHSVAISPNETVSSPSKKTSSSVSCTCRKSGCNKLYCNCFRAGLSCSGNCSCTSCLNTSINVVVNSKKLQSKQQQMSKQSCQCRRTSCLKNYCACFNSGKHCTDECRCTSCYNFVGSEKLAVKRIVESYNKDMGK